MSADLETVVVLLRRGGPLLSVLLAAWIVGRTAERSALRFGLPRPEIAALTPALAMTAIVAARVVAVVPHWRVVAAHPLDLLRITDQLSLVGGVAGTVAGLFVLARRAQLPLLPVADLYGMAMPLGVAAYGASCLLRDDCYGRVAAPPLGIVFPGLEAPRYPVGLYTAAAAFFAAGTLAWMSRHCSAPGVVALGAIALLGAIRVLLAPLRLDAESTLLGADQLITLAVTAIALVVLQIVALRWRRREGTAITWPTSRTADTLRLRGRSPR